jgi:hypothetical protein
MSESHSVVYRPCKRIVKTVAQIISQHASKSSFQQLYAGSPSSSPSSSASAHACGLARCKVKLSRIEVLNCPCVPRTLLGTRLSALGRNPDQLDEFDATERTYGRAKSALVKSSVRYCAFGLSLYVRMQRGISVQTSGAPQMSR